MDEHHHTATSGGSNSTAAMNNSATGGGSGGSPIGDSGKHDEARLNADSDDGSQAQDPGKMFIGGLSWQTTAGEQVRKVEKQIELTLRRFSFSCHFRYNENTVEMNSVSEGLRDYFGRFGEVNECMVMRDPATKRARGFGFITFVDPASVDRVLAAEEHELDGKKVCAVYLCSTNFPYRFF
ncbi:unnamed protein product [Nippostrongylus brasiliensis]|uniref:Rna-binding protein musashi-related (inferred by orthology to a S. mansoni protein) n=1 Tax=Nippostrongylus brasiliensis TaxID=27835 RepID=A0A0N4XZU3_NIPBR|nr:unnamed protein product [Nippostrongylus brasiliensis]